MIEMINEWRVTLQWNCHLYTRWCVMSCVCEWRGAKSKVHNRVASYIRIENAAGHSINEYYLLIEWPATFGVEMQLATLLMNIIY